MQEEWSGTTLIPYYQIVIPATNIISTIFCVFIFIFPEKHFFLYFVLLFQAVFTSLTEISLINCVWVTQRDSCRYDITGIKQGERIGEKCHLFQQSETARYLFCHVFQRLQRFYALW